MSRFDMTPEEAAAYEKGWKAGLQAAKVLSRPFDSDQVRAFGTLRRAAIIIRSLEASADDSANPRAASLRRARAHHLRSLIRSVLGSDKA